MKQNKHIKKAVFIGNDSFELIHYSQLPRNASVKRQVEALQADQRWQENHNIEISKRIDYLIQDIETEKNSNQPEPEKEGDDG